MTQYYIVKKPTECLVWCSKDITSFVLSDKGVTRKYIDLFFYRERQRTVISRRKFYELTRLINTAYFEAKKEKPVKKSEFFSLKEGETYWSTISNSCYINRGGGKRDKITISPWAFEYYPGKGSDLLDQGRQHVINIDKSYWENIYSIFTKFSKRIEKWLS